jgi:pimeloyl-ACP methyl ester carboxylesterase
MRIARHAIVQVIVPVATLIFSLVLTLTLPLVPAFADGGPKRPLIFVPGILGSRLCDASENIIWGNATSFNRFADLELDSTPAKPPLHHCGLVDEIQILGSLWIHNSYKSWLKGLADIGFSTENKTLFIFDYDWRLSNFENARLLDAFITKSIGQEKKFDLIAHSMGGIVSRIYLDQYPSAASVTQIIYLGTPFLGSMNTFGTIKEGWGWPFNNLAGGQDVVARVALSFPSMLELLPRYNECCYIRKTDGSRQSLNVFDPGTWRSLHWLPPAYLEPAAFARFSTVLRRSESLTKLLAKPAPSGIYEMIFASDSYDTLRLLGMKDGATVPAQWIFSSSKGDGTVPVYSVARRVDSDGYSNVLPSFAKHEHLFDDKWVDQTLFNVLASGRPNQQYKVGAPGRPVLSVQVDGAPATWEINIAGVQIDRPLFKPGDTISATITIELEDTANGVASGLYKPTAALVQGGASHPLAVQEITSADDVVAKQLRFVATGVVSADEGVGVVVFPIDDVYQPSKAFYISQAAN